jgi:hypothetical protein
LHSATVLKQGRQRSARRTYNAVEQSQWQTLFLF